MFWNKWRLKRLQQEIEKKEAEKEQPDISKDIKRDSLNIQTTANPSKEAQAKQKRDEVKR